MAGLLSAPEASEKMVSSRGFLGVVNAGFLKGAAAALLAWIWGEKKDV
jgi:hypothetical protein